MKTQSFAATEFAVTRWADKVGITKHGKLEGQLKKLYEEVDELRDAIVAKDNTEMRDAIGDIMIVLTMISLLTDNDLRQCYYEAGQIVTKRKGHMTDDGIFVKEA
jgi:NTP pyrophosphatase (non-canonical NTP hydrolase)